MRVQEPLSFSVSHSGRGGEVTCRCAAGQISLALEMVSGGEFSVWLRGASLTPSEHGKVRRLRADERELVADKLRDWLDREGRPGWVIER